jgi:hypothetical protein
MELPWLGASAAKRVGAAYELTGRKSDDDACNDQTPEVLKHVSQKPLPGNGRNQ